MNIAPGVYNNWSIERGADFSATFNITIDEVVLDLTGANVYAQLRDRDARDATLLADFTVVVDGSHNITLSLTDVQTAAIEARKGYFDVLVVDSAGVDTYYLQGKMKINPSVTVKP